jgi:hypothetical protein
MTEGNERASVPPDPNSTAYTEHPSPSGGPVPADEGSVVAGPEGSTQVMAQEQAAEEFRKLRDAE